MSLNELSEAARWVTTPISIGLILVGLFFLLVAAIGVVRFPDVYTRSHAVSLTDSLGAFFLLGGLALYEGFSTNLVTLSAGSFHSLELCPPLPPFPPL